MGTVVTLRPNYDNTQDSAYPLGGKPAPGATYPTTFDYYIGPSGDTGANPGTIGSPWGIDALASKGAVIAGKTIGILDGTYRSPIGTGNNSQWVDIPATSSGTMGAPTRIAAVNSRVPQFTDNNGSGVYSTNACYMFQCQAAWCEIWGLRFEDCGWASALRVGAAHIDVRDCLFKDYDKNKSVNGQSFDSNYGCIRSQSLQSSYITVKNCKFQSIWNNCFPKDANCRASACGPNFLTANWIVEECTFIDVMNATVYQKRECGNTTVRYNYYERTGTAIEDDSTYNMGATPLLGDDTTSEMPSTPIYATQPNYYHHNIFVNVNSFWSTSGEVGMNIVENRIYNNTFLARDPWGSAARMFIFNYGLQSRSPTPAKNQDFYNNICGFMNLTDGSGHGVGSREWFLGYQNTDDLRFILRTVDYNSWHNFDWQSQKIGDAFRWTSIATAQAAGFEAGGEVLTSYGFSNLNGRTPASYRVVSGNNMTGGRVGGVSSGAVCARGAWDGVERIYGTHQIGCNF